MEITQLILSTLTLAESPPVPELSTVLLRHRLHRVSSEVEASIDGRLM
jgi:hypothetical protein